MNTYWFQYLKNTYTKQTQSENTVTFPAKMIVIFIHNANDITIKHR